MLKLRFLFSILLPVTLFFFGCNSSKKSTTQKKGAIIKTARSYTGTPYRYGGINKSGIDCSGLIVRSFESAGVELPRTSDAQSKIGKKVALGDLEEGDLVFFAMGKKKRKITHVGLVTDIRSRTDIRFIHASTKLGVMETNLKADYYWERIVVARRPFENLYYPNKKHNLLCFSDR